MANQTPEKPRHKLMETTSTSDPSATWAPQSPDLSTYHGTDNEPEHPQHQAYRGSISHAALSPPLSSPTSQPHPPHPVDPPLLTSPQHFAAPQFASPSRPRGSRTDENMQDADPDYVPDASDNVRGKRRDGNGSAGAPDATTTNPDINITVHFPVARIKRIMQADDDVGKVAQVTPVVVSKALELFMISLVTKAAAEAKARNSKRVGALHLKQAITKDVQFDFLNEIVSKIPDAPSGDKSEGDAMDVDGKKRKAGGRKKKKNDDDSS